jgi:hypothetical protein
MQRTHKGERIPLSDYETQNVMLEQVVFTLGMMSITGDTWTQQVCNQIKGKQSLYIILSKFGSTTRVTSKYHGQNTDICLGML